jgi:CheY-like chemotaxis protein
VAGPRPRSLRRSKTQEFTSPCRGTIPESPSGQERDVLTNGGTFNGATTHLRRPVSTAAGTQKVVIVNGSPQILELLENVLDAGRYDIVFVESSEHAYSQIKRVQPNLVILCVRIDAMETFQVLSMLKLDDETRQIPILTYTADVEGQETEDETAEASEAEIFAAAQVLRMN